MKVAACIIVLDTDPERKKLTRLFDSTEKAGITDYVVGIDSRSLPDTGLWIAERLGRKVTNFSFTFADDFAKARQETLARIPEGTDWWTWIDSDDTLECKTEQAIPQFLEGVRPETAAVFCHYDYDKDAYGNSTTILVRGRFYRANVKWEWKGRVHEDVYPPEGRDWGPDFGLERTDDFLWVHDTADRPSADERNMRLLALSVAEDPDNPRNYYYLGNQHFASHRWIEAVESYEKYVGLSNWTEQKWDALIHQAIAFRSLGLYDDAIMADTRAMHLVPEWADSYLGLGETYCRQGDWQKSIYFGEWGLQRSTEVSGIPDPVVFVNTNAYAHNPYRWLEVAYWNIGERDKSLKCLELAAQARPEPELLAQIEHHKWSIGKEEITKQGMNLAAGLMRRNEPLKARAILENLPAGASENANVQVALAWTQQRLRHLDSKTDYANLYFTQEETVKPEDAIKAIDELPRMKWALRRIRAAGVTRVLEVGVGNAAQSLYLAQNGIQVVGIDIDRRRVRAANAAAVRMGLLETKLWCAEGHKTHSKTSKRKCSIEVPDITRRSRYQVHLCDVTEIAERKITLSDGEEVLIPDLGPFGMVTATEIIEHVADPKALLDAVQKCGTRFLVSTPDGGFEGPHVQENIQHVRAYTQRELTALVMNRGRIVESHKIASPYSAHMEDDLVTEFVVGETLGEESVVFWCFDTGQGWTPDSIREGGIGGSETAIIRVAEELAKRGKRVHVYAECEGVWNGVRYSLVRNFRPAPCDLFVAWRSVGPIPQMAGLAKRRVIWSHDTDFGPATGKQLAGVTVVALSDWQKQHLEGMYPDADITVIGNGIDAERFTTTVERVPHRLIYAQSPDRGLDRVLRLMPQIRAGYPDAELHVFYGSDMARKRNPAYIAEVERLARQPGVTLHGRVGQERLAEEYLKADALIYPAELPGGKPFNETFSISMVEALAAGCFPVTSDHGALRETNMGGAHVRLDTFDKDALFQLMAFWRRPLKEQENIRDHGHEDKIKPGYIPAVLSGRMWARTQTWAVVAEQWEALMVMKPVAVETAAE